VFDAEEILMTTDDAEALHELAGLIRERNANARAVTQLVGRPALLGHLGEFVASVVFDIVLEKSATAKGIDGHFASGPLQGKTVNIKWYGKEESLLDIRPDAIPDYYLVLTGPRGRAVSSRGEARCWSIDSVFLFESAPLLSALTVRGVQVGVATSIVRALWSEAEIYPTPGARLSLSQEQRLLLDLFSSANVDAR
jgi:hypothetical protein